MKAVPICPVLGLELRDVDLSGSLSKAEVTELRGLFAEHHLLLVRDQQLSPELHNRFAGYFGEMATLLPTDSDYISNLRPEDITGTGRLLFHSDGTFHSKDGVAREPPCGLSLYAEKVSATSPPTFFASAVAVYEQLPGEKRKFLETLRVMQLQEYHPEKKYRRVREVEIPAGAPAEMYLRAVHPLIKTLPNSTQKAVFASENNASHIMELPLDEGEAILQELFKLLYRENNVYTHYWRNGDVIVWNNIALQHARPAITDPAPRVFHRVVLEVPLN